MDAERDKIEAAQFAVDGEIEQGEFPDSKIQLQPNPDSPDLLQLWLLAEQLAFVPRRNAPSGLRRRIGERSLMLVSTDGRFSTRCCPSRSREADVRGHAERPES